MTRPKTKTAEVSDLPWSKEDRERFAIQTAELLHGFAQDAARGVLAPAFAHRVHAALEAAAASFWAEDLEREVGAAKVALDTALLDAFPSYTVPWPPSDEDRERYFMEGTAERLASAIALGMLPPTLNLETWRAAVREWKDVRDQRVTGRGHKGEWSVLALVLGKPSAQALRKNTAKSGGKGRARKV